MQFSQAGAHVDPEKVIIRPVDDLQRPGVAPVRFPPAELRARDHPAIRQCTGLEVGVVLCAADLFRLAGVRYCLVVEAERSPDAG
jgi:hypothetical protein